MIGGFSQTQGGLDIYHWECIIGMAWFSSVAHLPTLAILREEAKPNKTLKIVRTTAMGALIFMIVYGIVPIGYTMALLNTFLPSTPTWCLFHPGVLEGGEGTGGRDPFITIGNIHSSLAVSLF
jgi:hypothetical protein